jgi:hypothetical protein
VVADATAITAFISTFPVGTSAVVIAEALCAVISGAPATAGRRGLETVTIDGVTYPSVTLRGVTVPYARIGTALAARLRATPLRCAYVNGVCVPVAPSPF